MTLNEELKEFSENIKKDVRQLYKKVKQYPLISLFFIIAILLVIALPYLQVNYQGISNNTEKATLENQYRATFAQILGGVAIGIGLYYTWRRITIAEENLKATQDNLKTAQESQITERFTRAIDQLGAIDQFGNPAIEIRLGGIYALERIANESDKDYWPIIEILMSYIRKNSSIEDQKVREQNKISLDIQAILTVIRRRNYSFNSGESNHLDFQRTYLRAANLHGASLQHADFTGADLQEADLTLASLKKANLEDAKLQGAYLLSADLRRANLYGADIRETHLTKADLFGALLGEANLEMANLVEANFRLAFLEKANIKGADIRAANLEGAFLAKADLEMADLGMTNLIGIKYSSLDQFSKVKSLNYAKLDEWLETTLREKYPALFEESD